jgi:serine/threonine protein kinase/tetratricopeptide (TPR) repeat protein
MNHADRQIMSILGEAVELGSPEERAAFLDEACADNPERRARVEALIRAYESAGHFLQGKPASTKLAASIDNPITEGPGALIGPYKLLEQIGEGGFGVVFMAEQQQPIRRKVALKVLKPGMDTRQVVARFEAERQALALMDHPNIAQVHDGGETASRRPYFVMELVRGVPITDFCDQNQLPIRERLELFVSVCQAVQHAHQKGVIHRDLKPSNVMVTLHDDKAVVKVIDFGIAKATGQQLTEKTLFTNFDQMIGTPLYMSPEQAQMSGLDVDTRSDIYSLGVLLYELLTGTTPFDKERFKEVGYDEMRRIIREEEPPTPSTRISSLSRSREPSGTGPARLAGPTCAGETIIAETIATNRKSDPKRLRQLLRGELDWIVMKALEKDRNRRYETANGLARDIQRYLNDEPVQACPPSAWYRSRKFARRHKAGLAVVACLLGGLAVLAGSIGWVAGDRARRHQDAAQVVQRNLEEAQQLQQRGRWREAEAAVQGAEGLLASAGDPEDLCTRCRQVRADLEMLAKIELAKLDRAAVRGNRFDHLAADRAYRAAFEGYGLPVLDLESQEAAERIAASAITRDLVAALDDWVGFVWRRDIGGRLEGLGAAAPNPAERDHLRAVAQLADRDRWRHQIRDAISRGDKTQLLDLSRQGEVHEQPPATLVLLAQFLARTDLPAATDLLRRTQPQHPDDFWMNHELGLCLCDSKPPRLEEAIGYFRTALALRPQSPGAWQNLGGALNRNGEIAAAFAALQQAVRLKPDYPTPHCELGYCLNRKGQFGEGLTECQLALRLDPEYPCALVNKATALRKMGRFGEALSAFDQAIHINPEFTAAHWNKADTLQEMGRYGDCLRAVEEALHLDPQSVDALNTLAWLLATCPDSKFRDAPRAVQVAKKALALNPKDGFSWQTLAVAQYRLRNWKATLESLQKVTELGSPGDSFEWFFVAMAHWQLNEKEEARQWYDKAVQWMEKNDPKNQELIRFRAEAAELLGVKESKK